MNITQFIPQFAHIGGPPRSASTKTWVHVLFAASAVDCAAISIYHFILQNYATSIGAAALSVPLLVGYYHAGSSRTIEQLNHTFTHLNKELEASVPEIKSAVREAQEMLADSQGGFKELTDALSTLSKVLEIFPTRLNENDRAHAPLDRALYTSEEIKRTLDELDNV